MLFGRALLHDVTVSDLTSEVARAGEDTGGEYLGSMDAGQGVRAKSGEAGTSPGPMAWRGSSLGKWGRSALTDPLPSPPPFLPPSRSLSFSPSLFLSPYTHTLSIINFIRAYA